MVAFCARNTEVGRAQRLLGALSESAQEPGLYDCSTEDSLPPAASLDALFYYAGVNSRARSALRNRAIAVGFTVLMLVVASGKPLLLLLLPMLALVQYWRLTGKIYRRAEAFEKDYTALLLSLASAVRTGMDPLVALSQGDRLFAAHSEVGREIARTRQGIEQGKSEEEVLRLFASSIKHPDIGLFRTAFILARKEGASLGECLQRMARVTRQRQSFRRKMKSAVAMQKLSAFGIAGCTIVIGVLQWVGNPTAIVMALAHPVGFKLLLTGLAFVALGLGWMLRLARARI